MLHELQHPQSCRAVHISLHTICQSYTHCETVAVYVCVCVSSPIRECCCFCCHQPHLAASCLLPLSFVTFWLFLATCAGPFPLHPHSLGAGNHNFTTSAAGGNQSANVFCQLPATKLAPIAEMLENILRTLQINA